MRSILELLVRLKLLATVADGVERNIDSPEHPDIHSGENIQVRAFLHLVKANHEVNHEILACDWPTA